MSFPLQGFHPIARLTSSSFYKRLRRKPRFQESRPELMPQLDAAQKAEIIETINDLNRQVLSEVSTTDRDH